MRTHGIRYRGQVLDRRSLLCGCMACFAAALVRPAPAYAEGAPPLGFRTIAEGVTLHTSWFRLETGWFPSNGIVVTGSERVLLVDTAWTSDQTEKLLAQIDATSGGKPVDRLLITHAHDDRMAGLEFLHRRGAESIAHSLTVAEAKRKGMGDIRNGFEGATHVIDLGGRKVEAFHPGAAHTRDNIVVHVEDARLLFGGCMLRAAASGIGNLADADVCAWPASIREVTKRYASRTDVVVPGHGEPGDAGLLAHTEALAEKAAKQNCRG